VPRRAPHDSAPSVVIQPQDCHDETPGEGIWPRTPLCDEAEFAELVDEMVADEAPRLFAVVQEYGERVDGRIAAWGMAFDDHAEIISVDDDTSVSLSSPERAAHGFNHRPNITPRVVWVNPDATTPPDEIENGVADSDADTRSSATHCLFSPTTATGGGRNASADELYSGSADLPASVGE
jgi:hypothetical protein